MVENNVMPDLRVNLCGVELKNPIVPASGTCGFGIEMLPAYDINVLGGMSLKGTTKQPRYGNESPRIAECEGGMLNAVGLQNPGIEALVGEKLPALRKLYKGCIIANISGFSIDEYVHCCRLAGQAPEVDIVEVNISCPNVHAGGMAFGTQPECAAQVTEAVKKVCPKPVFMKLSPNVTDIVSVAKACEDAGADGLTLINTVMGMRIDIARRRPVLANRTGGISGRCLLPLAVRMVNQVFHACHIPIMGCGGVATAENVIEMVMAGATAVQIGAENLRNPFVCKEIAENLPSVMQRLKINNLTEIRGIV